MGVLAYRRLPIEVESPEERGGEPLECNLTESSVRDLRLAELAGDLSDLGDLALAYVDHRGHPELRAALARLSGPGVGAADVLVTPGAAAALFLVSTALLERGAHAIVAKPNYATNLETPLALGADVTPLELRFEESWRLEPARVAARLRPSTRLVSLTAPQNPTGATMTRADLEAVVAHVEASAARLLVDETYREMVEDRPLPAAASLSTRAISISSLSKTYGLPGLRIGWLVTRDPRLYETLLAAKEQIFICGSALDEALATRAFARHDELLARCRAVRARHLAQVEAWIARTPEVEWVRPAGGVVAFPRLVEGIDPEIFYAALAARRTAVGPGHWFDLDRRFFRLGFGWPETAELERGLANLSAAIAEARR
ncbi:MAG: aminotransferase class I/II-fold pyridoxal phosphate-dependent enzyme [Thermoanaerobaculia bacterium]